MGLRLSQPFSLQTTQEPAVTYDLAAIRECFPALSIRDNGMPRIYFDNPAGTQVPSSVAEAMNHCMFEASANLGGVFRTSVAADRVVLDARLAMADFLNAPSEEEIVFGQNMTSLTFHIARSIGRYFKAGDEIILSRMCHDGNVYPWVLMARDHGLTVKWLPFNTETYEFDLDRLDELLSDRTRLVCVGGASNLTGTLNDVKTISDKARAVGAWTYVDAVQSAPHVSTDVQAIGCDFLVCSAYKFFGPHQGILWRRRDILEALEPYKLRPADDEIPWRFETGTQSHEGMAGVQAAVDYFARIGETMAQEHHANHSGFSGRRQHVHAAMDLLFDYEKQLAGRLIEGLQKFPGVIIRGVTDPHAFDRRVPTVAFTAHGKKPLNIVQALAERNIFAWSGHNFAVEVVRALGLEESGGVVRIGPVHYNSTGEIDTLLAALTEIL
jgi:cysteine desulfurase family protein (TIGR01976 family)